jgi:AcrR family transcriptional regulator
VEEVARRLGVGASTLYRHLPGGEEWSLWMTLHGRVSARNRHSYTRTKRQLLCAERTFGSDIPNKLRADAELKPKFLKQNPTFCFICGYNVTHKPTHTASHTETLKNSRAKRRSMRSA